jgi:hypothetical protein
LKDLLSKVAKQEQITEEAGAGANVAILQVLLLPTGLNLRNLLWHGFVGAENYRDRGWPWFWYRYSLAMCGTNWNIETVQLSNKSATV